MPEVLPMSPAVIDAELEILRSELAAEVEAADAAKAAMAAQLADFDRVRGRLKAFLLRIDLLSKEQQRVAAENAQLRTENAQLRAQLAALLNPQG